MNDLAARVRVLTDEAMALDRTDALAGLRSQFLLPRNTVYLDGNSLGALSRASQLAVERVVRREWGEDLIASWNKHQWIDLPRNVGEKVAPLIGAGPGQVLCCDSISVNLFKLLSAALALRPGRRVVLVAEGDFPTDGYMATALAEWLGDSRCEVRSVPAARLADGLDADVAVLLLTEVNYRSGERYNMRTLTDSAHAAGALVLWDLAHSAGAMPVALDDCGVDMAVGCGYKYFNGGPGAPAFVYVNERHHGEVSQPLAGWLGHRYPFAFDARYEAAAGIGRFQAGTPPIISMVALDAALDIFDQTDLDALRRKSLALTDQFLLWLENGDPENLLRCVTPSEHEKRGSQISLCHPEAWGISQALIEAGVIVDFRAPDIVRFGFAPLYNSFADVAQAALVLGEILRKGSYINPRYAERPAVT